MLPYREQMKLFARAEMIAGVHGSGLVNAIFMGHRTGMCELAPAGLDEDKVPNMWMLAASGAQPYGISVGDAHHHDAARFERVLGEVVQAATLVSASG
jgi:capsular polysaccharide biosynthesis protein